MKTEIKMSETDQDDQSIPHSAISDSSFDTDGEDPDGDDSERMTNSTRNHVNVLTTFKEDSDTFAAIKTVLAVLFGLTAFGSTVMVYSLTRGYEIQVFESKVGFIWRSWRLTFLFSVLLTNLCFCLLYRLFVCYLSAYLYRFPKKNLRLPIKNVRSLFLLCFVLN